MIDIKKAEEEFKIYTSKYNMNEPKILMKYNHTFRVEELCGQIASMLKLDKEKVNIAKLIGLFHDLARFEQYTKYKTYDDLKSIDHGDLAVEILKSDNYIRKYIETDKYDNNILKSIEYHNKYSIGDDLDEEGILFSKIIRDADKLDIIYIKVNETLIQQKEKVENELITKEVFEQFMAKETVNRLNVKNKIDTVIVLLAFIYDINFKETYKIIKENRYVDRIIDLFDFKEKETIDKMKLIKEKTNEYLDMNC